MRYVILRDDDTNGLTPPECLDRLYRPFLDHGFPVNLAVIPRVSTWASRPDGEPEGFLFGKDGSSGPDVPIHESAGLIAYLKANPGYRIIQHGYHHDTFEFDRHDPQEVVRRLEEGARCLDRAGWAAPSTFVAPHDKFSPVSYKLVAQRFAVISTGWFELRRLPASWWPRYLRKKIRGDTHWRIGRTTLLAHPGCLLSCYRPVDGILDAVKSAIRSQTLTVLVTHWWEYFDGLKPNEPFIQALHRTGQYLASQPDVRVVSFDDVAHERVPLN